MPGDPEGRFVLLVNEEGRLHDLPLNRDASTLVGEPIRGNAVLMLAKDFA